MQKEKLFRKVETKKRMPIRSGKYDTSVGEVIFHIEPHPHTNYAWWEVSIAPEWWLEEIELPTDDNIIAFAEYK